MPDPHSLPPDAPPPPLAALAAAAAEGDDRAFEELHRRLGGGLRRFIHKRIGAAPEIIEELSQNAWVEVWRALRGGRYDPARARITTFVYAIGYKMVLRYARAAKRDASIAALLDEAQHPAQWLTDSTTDFLHQCELLDALRHCLRHTGGPLSLSDEERDVVTGSAAGESERDLARRLGLAASTINARKKTAYAKLRTCLGGKGFISWSGEQPETPGE